MTAFIRAAVGERDLWVGVVSSIQTHGSLANWHPHLHLLVTDGGGRPDGTFVRLPRHDVAILTAAFRRAVLTRFVRRGRLDSDTAAGMLAGPHSGFHGHDGVWAPADDRALAVRLARSCARTPVALGRLEYQDHDRSVTYHSAKPTGPTAGSETTDAREFLARVVSHIPDKGQVLQRYYGWYASRVRGRRRRATDGDTPPPLVAVEPSPEPPPRRASNPGRRRGPHPSGLTAPSPTDILSSPSPTDILSRGESKFLLRLRLRNSYYDGPPARWTRTPPGMVAEGASMAHVVYRIRPSERPVSAAAV